MNSSNELFDKICKVLTDYENPTDASIEVSVEDLYNTLCEVVNNWDIINQD